MKKNEIKLDWMAWNSQVAREHEIQSILRLTSPMQRLQWLASTLDDVIKMRASAPVNWCAPSIEKFIKR